MPDKILLEENIDRIEMPENLAIGLMVARQREKCLTVGCKFDYYGFAFGQSPFPPPEPLARALAEAAGNSGYADAEGMFKLREAAARFNARHLGLEADPERIVVGPGTKGLIFLLLSIISGELIIPVPSWIGYAPQARFLGKTYHLLPLKRENDYKLTAGQLEAFLAERPGKQHLLVLNNPHNPTGQVYSSEELSTITAVCRKYGTIVLADEIYALTAFNFAEYVSMGAIYPEGAFVLNGLSKDHSAGGYRLGICRLPDTDCRKMRRDFQKLAATVYTNVTTPVQLAAAAAYSAGEEIDRYFVATRKIHSIMGLALQESFAAINGLQMSKPAGGFYFYVSFNSLRDELYKCGVVNANQLCRALMSHPYHIATVTGDALLLPPEDFGARIAYVDYDGRKAYEAYLASPPRNRNEEAAFARKYAPMMFEGAEALTRFVSDLKDGKLKEKLADQPVNEEYPADDRGA